MYPPLCSLCVQFHPLLCCPQFPFLSFSVSIQFSFLFPLLFFFISSCVRSSSHPILEFHLRLYLCTSNYLLFPGLIESDILSCYIHLQFPSICMQSSCLILFCSSFYRGYSESGHATFSPSPPPLSPLLISDFQSPQS